MGRLLQDRRHDQRRLEGTKLRPKTLRDKICSARVPPPDMQREETSRTKRQMRVRVMWDTVHEVPRGNV